jgi:hypothetical protein
LVQKYCKKIDPIYCGSGHLAELNFTGVVTSTQINLRDAIGTTNTNVLIVYNNGDHVEVQGLKLDEQENV